jgi:aryl-alcohol dehydrogenase-like predicted oxidoreductase
LSESGELTGWTPNGRPGHLRSACEASLRRLELDRIDLYQLHTPDPAVPFAESIGALKDLQNEGKIRHIGVANVTLEQLAVARTVADIGTVQNRLDLSNSRWRDMLNECETHEIGFIPYRPLRAWDDAAHRQVLTSAASRLGASTDQIALAWLLAVSPVTLPIPGTATRAHLEDNLAAAALRLEQTRYTRSPQRSAMIRRHGPRSNSFGKVRRQIGETTNEQPRPYSWHRWKSPSRLLQSGCAPRGQITRPGEW